MKILLCMTILVGILALSRPTQADSSAWIKMFSFPDVQVTSTFKPQPLFTSPITPEGTGRLIIEPIGIDEQPATRTVIVITPKTPDRPGAPQRINIPILD